MNFGSQIRRAIRKHVRSIAVETLSRLAHSERDRSSIEPVPSVQILLMHDLCDGEQDRFRQLLTQLADRFAFVNYSEAVNRIVTGEIDHRYLAFSFDDGLRGCLTAANILEEFGTRGMFFVCPRIIDADMTQQAEICRKRLWIDPTPFLSWANVEQLAHRGHEFGSHSLNHIDLGRASSELLTEEMGSCKAELQQKLGVCEHFAWPYGRFSNFTEQARHLASTLGFASCASGERGSHAAHTSRSATVPCIRRESIDPCWPIRHVNYFLQRSGQTPRKPDSCWPRDWNSFSYDSASFAERAA